MAKPKPLVSDPDSLTKIDIAKLLDETAVLLEVLGENPFRSRAFANASRAIATLGGDLREMVESKELLKVQGIGKGIFGDIEMLLTEGRFPIYQESRKKLPNGVLDMLKIPGLGPKKVRALWEKLNIKSIPDLEKAIAKDKVAELPGFGKKTQERITASIANMQKFADRFLYSKALAAATPLFDTISKRKDVKQSLLGGSLRRRKETIGDIDILVTADDSTDIMEAFTSYKEVVDVIGHGSTKSSVILGSGINVDLRVVKDDEFAFASHYFTGSKDHNTKLRGIAKKAGFKLNEYGLFQGEKPVKCKDEAALFKKLGLDYIEPELREDMGEIDAAETGTLPTLVTEKDIRGVFHCHTTMSDGMATLREMVDAAKALGHSYFGVADHSQSAIYANGLLPEDLKEQAKEIAKINAEDDKFRVFHGTESDILPDGSLDYDEETLASLDYVVASIHGQLTLTEAEMTRRIIKAVENPYTTMIGHLTGRLLLRRDGYKVNVTEVIDACAEHGVMIEINAHPSRLDLDWRFCKYAKEKGVMIPINPDAHTTDGIADFRYGVGVARKGWLEKKNVLNTYTIKQVEKIFAKRRA